MEQMIDWEEYSYRVEYYVVFKGHGLRVASIFLWQSLIKILFL